jgi:hypothetical protein
MFRNFSYLKIVIVAIIVFATYQIILVGHDAKVIKVEDFSHTRSDEDASKSVSATTVLGIAKNSISPLDSGFDLKNTEQYQGLNLNVDEAKHLLVRISNEIENVELRAKLSSIIMIKLCQTGFAKDAWDLVEVNIGLVRSYEISALLTYDSREFETVQQKLFEINDPKEFTAGLLAFAASHITEISKLNFSKITDKDRMMLSQIMANAVTTGSKHASEEGANVAIWQTAAKLFEDKVFSAKNLEQIIRFDNTTPASQQWNLLLEITKSKQLTPAESIQLKSVIVPKIVRENFGNAMNTILADSETKYAPAILKSAIDAMYESDTKSANKWVAENINKIDPASAQRIIASVAQVAIRDGDYVNAQRWASQLLNPQVRSQVEKQIEEYKNPAKP